MIDVQGLKQKAIDYIKANGPSIPVRLARELKVDPIWAGAILSELIQTHDLKISSMKIGSTPVYYLEGQGQQLEKFADEHLKGAPKEAYLLLKEKTILDDAMQEPQMRVALRSLKDFAVMNNDNGRIVWRYAFAAAEEVKEISDEEDDLVEEETIEEDAEDLELEEKEEKVEDEEVVEAPANVVERKVEDVFEEDQEGLLSRVKEKLERLNIKILEETDVKKRELRMLARMNGPLGETEILVMAKDKKSVTEKDFEKVFEHALEERKQVLLFITGEIAKKSIESYRKYKNIIRVRPL